MAKVSLEYLDFTNLLSELGGYADKLLETAAEPALKEITRKVRDDAKKRLEAHTASTPNSKSTGELARHISDLASRHTKDQKARAVLIRRVRKAKSKTYAKLRQKGFTLRGLKGRVSETSDKYKVHAYYGWMVEYGHKIVKNKKVVGYAKARPFMRPAVLDAKAKMLDIFKKHIGKLNDSINRDYKLID